MRLSQGTTQIWKVVSDVDTTAKRLLWVHPKPRRGGTTVEAGTETRHPYDAAADRTRPASTHASRERGVHPAGVGAGASEAGLRRAVTHPGDHAQYGPRVLAPLAVPQETRPASGAARCTGAGGRARKRDPNALLSTWLQPLSVSPDLSCRWRAGPMDSRCCGCMTSSVRQLRRWTARQ